MMKINATTIGAAALLLVGAACGEAEDDLLLENATYVAALSDGDGEALDEVASDDADGAAEEEADAIEAADGELATDCGLDAFRQRVIDEYDADGDGKLDEEERQALHDDFGEQRQFRHRHRYARRHLWQRLEWVYDADESGDLDAQERAQLQADLELRCENRQTWLLTHYDADGSGALDDAEWQAAREALQVRLEQRQQEMLATADANNDGQISEQERAQMREQQREQMSQCQQEMLNAADADGDGALDEQERATVRAQLRQRVRGEQLPNP